MSSKSLNINTSAIVVLLVCCHLGAAEVHLPVVKTMRTPHDGIQPQVAVGTDGTLHALYYKGDAGAGDVYYVRSTDFGKTFAKPLRVNSQEGSAIAAGTIRGAHMALGKHNRVHVAWNGSGKALPKGLPNPAIPEGSPYRLSMPMLYARMDDRGIGFEPQRNLMTKTYALDGGGSVAADDQGRVYVVWHGNATDGGRGEEARAVWVATSSDDGQTFSQEARANAEPTGACGCCGLRASAIAEKLYVLYRSAQGGIQRDMHVLVSKDHGRSFEARKLDDWDIGQCVMSSANFFPSARGMLAAWETEQQVKFGLVDGAQAGQPWMTGLAASNSPSQKHPTLAVNDRGDTLLAWTEGTGWQKGGTIAWQVFDATGLPIPDTAGSASGVPVWGLVAAFANPNGDFTVVY